MLTYLADIMEDTTDVKWASAKASHAIMLCEMERGSLTWFHTDRIDRIRKAHAQKHSISHGQNWGKNNENRRPWSCKAFQSGMCTHSKDHDVGARIHKYICEFCLTQVRYLTHSEKDCHFAKRNMQTKNEQQAAQK